MRPVSKGLELTTFCQVIVISPRPHDIHDIPKLAHGVNLDAKPCSNPHSCYSPALEPALPSLLSDGHPSTTGRAGFPSSPPTKFCALRSASTDSTGFESHQVSACFSLPVLLLTLIVSFHKLVYCLFVRTSSRLLDRLGLFHIHWACRYGEPASLAAEFALRLRPREARRALTAGRPWTWTNVVAAHARARGQCSAAHRTPILEVRPWLHILLDTLKHDHARSAFPEGMYQDCALNDGCPRRPFMTTASIRPRARWV